MVDATTAAAAAAATGHNDEDELLMNQNHYQVLKVPMGSSFRTIQQAFYKQARLHHPDKGKKKKTTPTTLRADNDNDAATNDISASFSKKIEGGSDMYYYHKIQEAWECLRDPALKQEYDQELNMKTKRVQRMIQNSIPIYPNDCRYDENFTSVWYTCRCGYEINASDIVNEYDLLECPGCSLVYDASALFDDSNDNNNNDDNECRIKK